MSKSLAELRATPTPSQPTRSVRICLDQSLLADVQRLEAEKTDLLFDAQRTAASVDDEERTGPPRKAGQRAPEPHPRIAEIDAELERCWDKMRAAEGDLVLRAIPGGAWQRWKDKHPPRIVGHEEIDREGERIKGQPIYNAADLELAGGWCDAAALRADLGQWAYSWNGEEFAPGDWDGWLADRVSSADQDDLVRTVVAMQQVRVTIPKAPSASNETPSSASDSSSPDN